MAATAHAIHAMPPQLADRGVGVTRKGRLCSQVLGLWLAGVCSALKEAVIVSGRHTSCSLQAQALARPNDSSSDSTRPHTQASHIASIFPPS